MRKTLRSVALAAALCAAPAIADQIPLSIIGMNYGGDPTITSGFPYATGAYPNFGRFDRLYDSIRGATAHATWWSTLNPTAGNYTFTANLDPILATEAANNRVTEYTLSGVPAYVNGSQKVSGGTQLGQFTTFLTAMMAHVAGNGQCFGYFSLWNEVNQPSTFWTGTAAEMAALSAAAYPIIKAACPRTIVLSASTTSGVDTGSSPRPNGPFEYLDAYLAACTSGCFDAVNVHGYPQVPSLQTADTSIMYAPELLANTVTNAQSVALVNGFSSAIYLDEGYACSDPASTSFPANTVAYARCQATQLIIAAFAGVKTYANSFYGAGCTIPACGNEFFSGGPLKLTPAGVAKRNMISWLAGATPSGSFARTAGTNLIASAPNAASVATGNIGGLGGGGCPSPPAGTGSLPVEASPWALSATASIAGGMSYYVVNDGLANGLPFIDVRECGTDSSGANSDSIRMNNFTGAAVQGDNVVISACLGLQAGSLAGIREVDLQINEYTSVPAYANEFMVQSQIQPVASTTVSINQQCFQTRYVMKAATAAFAVPYILIKHYGSVAIDATFRIANPRLDVNSTRWSGVITRPGGYSATIAEDASGSGSITAPGGSVDYRDIFGGVYPTTGGATIHLTNSPILIENTAQTAYFPVLSAPGFVVSPTTPGASDSNPGTAARPFLTLNKCNSAMVATPSQRICYIRGVVSTTSFHVSLGTWTIYPGDPARSAIINLSASRSGANAANGIGSTSGATIKNLVFNGTATDGNGMFEFDSSSINFWGNTVTLSGAEQVLVLFNPQSTKVQGGTFTAPGNNSTNMISVISTDGITEQNVVLSDFTTVGSDRFVVEWIFTTPAIMKNSHLDRIVASGFHGTTGFGCISFVGSTSLSNTGNTVYGNTCTNTAANTELLVGIEMSAANTTFQANTINYLPFATSISQIPGGAILNNTIVMSTIFTPGGQGAYTAGGTYAPSSEWIGLNTITGSAGTNAVTGCVAGSTGYCTLGHGAYGAQPTLYAPSPVYMP